MAMTWVPGRSSRPSKRGRGLVVQQHTMSARATSLATGAPGFGPQALRQAQ